MLSQDEKVSSLAPAYSTQPIRRLGREGGRRKHHRSFQSRYSPKTTRQTRPQQSTAYFTRTSQKLKKNKNHSFDICRRGQNQSRIVRISSLFFRWKEHTSPGVHLPIRQFHKKQYDTCLGLHLGWKYSVWRCSAGRTLGKSLAVSAPTTRPRVQSERFSSIQGWFSSDCGFSWCCGLYSYQGRLFPV